MRFCSNCGKENTENNDFCSACGNQLNASSQNESKVNDQEPNVQNSMSNSSIYAILGWVFTAISTLFVPILFSGGGVIFGYLHRKVDKSHGTIIMIAAVACGIFGVVLGMATAPGY